MILPNSSLKKQADKPDHSVSEQLALLLEKDHAINELTRVLERKSDVISEQKKRIQILEEALRLSKVKRFSPSSEQSTQTSLFDEAEVESTLDFDQAPETTNEVDQSQAEEAASEDTKPTDTQKKNRAQTVCQSLAARTSVCLFI